MAINFYNTVEEGNISFFDVTYTDVFTPVVTPPYVYYDYAATIPDIRKMLIQNNSRQINFGFVHNGRNIPTCDYIKDPDAIVDYGCDWSAWLDAGEAITSVTWVIEDDGSIKVLDQDSTVTVTAALLSGGLSGKVYTLTCRITTDQDRTEDRSMYIICADQ